VFKIFDSKKDMPVVITVLYELAELKKIFSDLESIMKGAIPETKNKLVKDLLKQ
jgi:PII-like signaling protein